MNFYDYPLVPFSVLYAGITNTRNWLYDHAFLKSYNFPVPVINVGNLTVGGTGKTPHVEYLVRLLQPKQIAILSRGYKRETSGFVLATTNASAASLGDEPYQYHKKFPKVTVAVCEDRVKGINQLLELNKHLQVILLDDAFQHRPVHAQVNILLTDYNRLFFQDQVLPAGRLRESRMGASRADVVVVSKCPEQMPATETSSIKEQVQLYTKPGVPVFFSHYQYADFVPFGNSTQINKEIILVTGIAQPASLLHYLKQSGYTIIKHFGFPDHYYYKQQDIKEISNFAKSTTGCSILTTEKDWVKIASPEFESYIQQLPLFFVPIIVSFTKNQENFDQLILQTV